MDLAYLFLAEGAHIGDGRFFAFGGGVHYSQATSFPASLCSLAIVAGVWVAPEETKRDHRVELKGISPDGEVYLQKQDIGLPISEIPGRPDLPVLSILVVNLRGVPLPSPGTYSFVLSVDGVELGKVSFLCL
jgi:hypothetical protein